MAQPNANLNEIASTTIDRYSDTLADNVTNNNVLLAKMKANGNTKSVGGGDKILENLIFPGNSNGKWYTGPETLPVAGSEIATSGEFEWKQYYIGVTFDGLQELKNASRERIHNLLQAKLKEAQAQADNAIAAGLVADGTGNGGKEIGGLANIIAAAPGSGSVGGIAGGTYTWWQNQVYDFSTEGVTPSATTMTDAMNELFLDCQRGKDHIDMFVGGKTYFLFYQKSLQEQQRFMKEDKAGAGFAGLVFWGGQADVFYDANIADELMYGLNTNYLHYRPHSSRNFKRAEKKSAVNQDAFVVPLYWAGNMTVSNRSLQGRIQP